MSILNDQTAYVVEHSILASVSGLSGAARVLLLEQRHLMLSLVTMPPASCCDGGALIADNISVATGCTG